MIKLELTKRGKFKSGIFAFISEDDYESVSKYNWGVDTAKYTTYARAFIGGKTVRLHRFIMNIKDPKIMCDHKDGNGLNNTRDNLRVCTPSQNQKNKRSSGVSKYLGVHIANYKSYSKKQNKIVVYKRIRSAINHNGKCIHLGLFKTEKDAAIAYNIAAEKYHGEFARLNKLNP